SGVASRHRGAALPVGMAGRSPGRAVADHYAPPQGRRLGQDGAAIFGRNGPQRSRVFSQMSSIWENDHGNRAQQYPQGPRQGRRPSAWRRRRETPATQEQEGRRQGARQGAGGLVPLVRSAVPLAADADRARRGSQGQAVGLVLVYWWRMIFSENRYPLFGIMRYSAFHGITLRSISWNSAEVIRPRMPIVTMPTNMTSTCSSSHEFQIK